MNFDKRARLIPGSTQNTATADATKKAHRGPGRPTRNQAKQRELELLDKALDLFLEKGFERTTIDAITASVGMAKRTVYLRYHGKTELFKAALQRAIEEWIVPIERLRAAEAEDLEESLLRIGQILVENVMSPAGLRLLRITNAESGRMPEIGAFTYKQGTAPTLAYLADLIRRRIRPDSVEILDPEECALGFLYLIGGPANVAAWGLKPEKSEIEKHTRDYVRLFLHGLLPRKHAMGTSPVEVFQRLGTSESPNGGILALNIQKLKALEDENRRLKMLLADTMLQMAALKDSKGKG
jgi:TetR/AcrR family transcriptional regulator, mexJK operon transcriptional repressor